MPGRLADMFQERLIMLHQRTLIVTLGLVLSLGATGSSLAGDETPGNIHPRLLERLAGEPGPAKAWIFFTDKGLTSAADVQAAIAEVAANYNPRAVQRRQMRSLAAKRGEPLFTARDLPVHDDYLDEVRARGAQIHITSRWLNAASAYVTQEQAEQISVLPFVERLEAVGRSRGIQPLDVQPVDQDVKRDAAAPDKGGRLIDYGNASAQLSQINLINLHNEGYTGQGVIVGILDTGFHRVHEAFNNPVNPVQVVAEYDFIDNDGNTQSEPGDPYNQHDHGTMILGCIGAYMPGTLVGGAYDASFILCKTEDKTGEYPAEEDNYVAGLEFIEANGGDMSTASLGYIDWYTQADLDGQTAVTTIAVNISTSLGVHHCNAAGNEYHDTNPQTSHLIAPADAFQGITCGAVSSSGEIASFSSDGPTADGRVKPEICARGVSTATVDPFNASGYTSASGTSLSTPLVACAVACLIEARPYWTVDQMRENLFETADYFVEHGTYDPYYVYGYGILDAYAANDVCSDAGVVQLDRPAYACESSATLLVNDCGLDQDHNVIETAIVAITSTSDPTGLPVVLTETGPDSAEFVGSVALSADGGDGVLLVTEGDMVTVMYIDEDDGQGNYNVEVTVSAAVDCAPPVISNVDVTGLGPRTASILFDTNELARGTVRYGLSCDALTETASGSGFYTENVVVLSGLEDATTYFFVVDAEDQAGNVATSDNGGLCYMFETPDIPNFFTEEFPAGFDLANMMVSLTPTDTFDGYRGCAEATDALPTDPAGGTNIPLSDDDFEQINVNGGNQVFLYDTAYSSFFVGSNGYITFGSGDTDYTESLEDHFDLPRISALFDDLNPNSGGTISYKQLADRVAVTWQDVPEYYSTGANTFQVEMHFDGTLVIAYQAISAPDAIVGLSQGAGVPSEFYNSDFSGMGDCTLPGDLNCDGMIDFDDISPFVLALSGYDAYHAAYPDCNWYNADINGDGNISFDDIAGFVALLSGS